jgi:N-hydroxyarylamine O-acetyltransferase
MYEEMAAPLSDAMVDAYLKRLGLTRDALAFERQSPLRVLDTLIWAHQCAIPFETLDIAAGGSRGGGGGSGNGGTDILLTTAALFDKLVTRRRGGYCFELNGLFQRLLEALGFDVCAHLARAVINRDYLPPRLHRVMTVCLGGGGGGSERGRGSSEGGENPTTYLCDVGFGGPMPGSALPLLEGEHSDVTGTRFQLVRGTANGEPPSTWLLSRVLEDTKDVQLSEHTRRDQSERSTGYTSRDQDEPHHPNPIVPPKTQRLISFTTDAQIEADFITPNYYCSHAPDSHFVLNKITNIRKPHGSAHILNDRFKLVEHGETLIDRAIESPDDLQTLLQTYFGITR